MAEPAYELATEAPVAATSVTVHDGGGHAAPNQAQGSRAVSVPAPAAFEEDHEPVKPAVEVLRGVRTKGRPEVLIGLCPDRISRDLAGTE